MRQETHSPVADARAWARGSGRDVEARTDLLASYVVKNAPASGAVSDIGDRWKGHSGKGRAHKKGQ